VKRTFSFERQGCVLPKKIALSLKAADYEMQAVADCGAAYDADNQLIYLSSSAGHRYNHGEGQQQRRCCEQSSCSCRSSGCRAALTSAGTLVLNLRNSAPCPRPSSSGSSKAARANWLTGFILQLPCARSRQECCSCGKRRGSRPAALSHVRRAPQFSSQRLPRSKTKSGRFTI
jgi:hypothetical protein